MSEEQPSTADLPAEIEQRCLNCGAALLGPYCAACGQHVKHHVHSTWANVKEFIEDLFHADHRVWRTLVPLLLRPGLLTVEYLRGRRASYTSPFRLYIVLSLVFFLFASVEGDGELGAAYEDDSAAERAEPVDRETAALVDQLAMRLPQEERDEARKEILQALRDTPALGEAVTIAADPCDPNLLDARFPGSLGKSARVAEACRKVRRDSQSFQRALSENVPKMMFFFLPLIALAGKLLYIGSRRYYAEHLLFFVHFHSFFFLISLIAMAVSRSFTWLEGVLAGPWATLANLSTLAVVIYVPVYLYRAMRRMYGQGRPATIIKFFLLAIAYLIFMLLTLVALVLFTALTL